MAWYWCDARNLVRPLPKKLIPPVVVTAKIIDMAMGCIDTGYAHMQCTAVPIDTLDTVALLVECAGLNRIGEAALHWVTICQC